MSIQALSFCYSRPAQSTLLTPRVSFSLMADRYKTAGLIFWRQGKTLLLHTVKALWESGGIDLLIPNLGIRCRLVVSFNPLRRAMGTHLTGGLNDPRSRFRCFTEVDNLLALPRIEHPFFSIPTLRLVAMPTTLPRLTFLLWGCNLNNSLRHFSFASWSFTFCAATQEQSKTSEMTRVAHEYEALNSQPHQIDSPLIKV